MNEKDDWSAKVFSIYVIWGMAFFSLIGATLRSYGSTTSFPLVATLLFYAGWKVCLKFQQRIVKPIPYASAANPLKKRLPIRLAFSIAAGSLFGLIAIFAIGEAVGWGHKVSLFNDSLLFFLSLPSWQAAIVGSLIGLLHGCTLGLIVSYGIQSKMNHLLSDS